MNHNARVEAAHFFEKLVRNFEVGGVATLENLVVSFEQDRDAFLECFRVFDSDVKSQSVYLDLFAVSDLRDAAFNLGKILWDYDLDDLALRLFSVASASSRTKYSLIYADCLEWIGRWDEALEVAGRLVETNSPGWHWASALVAKVRFRHYSLTDDNVIDGLEVGYRISGDFAIDYIDALTDAGRFDKALEVLEAEYEKGNPLASTRLGDLLDDVFNDSRRAEMVYRRGVELGDKLSAYNLGVMLERLGRMEEAEHYLKMGEDQ